MYKEGFWNGTDPIKYRVVLGRLLPVPEKPMHWQNAFAGQLRQVVEVVHENSKPFLIDNQDGSGLKKVLGGDSPQAMHRSIPFENFVIRRPFPETHWYQFSPALYEAINKKIADYQRERFPEDFAKLECLRKSIERSNRIYPNKF